MTDEEKKKEGGQEEEDSEEEKKEEVGLGHAQQGGSEEVLEESILDIAHAAYQERTAAASAINRQLGLAGIAVIWVFKLEAGDRNSIEPSLIVPATLIVLSLGLDLLHYFAAGLIWGGYARRIEKSVQRGGSMPEYAPSWINWPAFALFVTKVVLMIVAYVLILRFLARTILG